MSGTGLYTHGHDDSVLRSHRSRTVANSAAYLADRLVPGVAVLDVGCGPGSITVEMAGMVAPGRVTAVETADAIMDEARALAVAAGVTSIEFAVADVHALDFPDDCFDVAHAHQVLQHVADPVQALREMRRVTRPGGVVAARDADYSAMSWFPRIPALDEWLALYRTVARENGGEPDAAPRLYSWARQAGFADVICSASTWVYATPDEREWWGGMWADRIRRSAVATQAVERGHATPVDLQRMSDGWREWVAAPDGWFGITHGEILGLV